MWRERNQTPQNAFAVWFRLYKVLESETRSVVGEIISGCALEAGWGQATLAHGDFAAPSVLTTSIALAVA